jgi:hypothetical protein
LIFLQTMHGDKPIMPVSTARQFDNAEGRVTYVTAGLLC